MNFSVAGLGVVSVWMNIVGAFQGGGWTPNM
jgi:hypothetical protein